MKWARVENGIVMEITNIDPEGRFTQEIVDQFYECPEEVNQGWTYVNGIWSAPIVNPGQTEEELKNQALDVLNYDYFTRKESLNKRHSSIILGNTDETKIITKTANIKAEFTALRAELLQKQEALLNGN